MITGRTVRLLMNKVQTCAVKIQEVLIQSIVQAENLNVLQEEAPSCCLSFGLQGAETFPRPQSSNTLSFKIVKLTEGFV